MAASTETTVAPTSLPRRSFIYRELERAGARFVAIGDGAVAAGFRQTPAQEVAAARKLAIVDLSPLPRTGFKGPGAADWLRGRKLKIGDESNCAWPCGKGSLAARLAPGEVLILGSIDGSDRLWERLDSAWTRDGATCWPVPRRESSFWFMVTGEQAPKMFAKVCGVDLRPRSFAVHRIAQTSVARTNCIVIRADVGETLAYHVLGDSASAGYLWGCLLDAMDEFAAGPVGLDALSSLAGSAARGK